jgi:hypothetical protein
MIAVLLTRLGLGSIGLKGLAWLAVAAGALSFVVWLCAKLYLAGVYAERIKIYESQIAQLKADLVANEVITRQSEADARASEEEERKLRELLDELQKSPPSCSLTREHVDGVRRIDEGP